MFSGTSYLQNYHYYFITCLITELVLKNVLLRAKSVVSTTLQKLGLERCIVYKTPEHEFTSFNPTKVTNPYKKLKTFMYFPVLCTESRIVDQII